MSEPTEYRGFAHHHQLVASGCATGPRRIGHALRISDDPSPPSGSWLLGFVAGLVPIAAVVALDPGGWFPFGVTKWWTVVTVALAACAMAMTRRAAPTTPLERAARWAWAALIGLVGLSTLTALDGVYAWVGTPIRHLGLLSWVVFAMLFAVGRRVGADEVAHRTFARSGVVAAVLLGVYCTVEAAFGAPVDVVSHSSRLGGPFGSASYLGAACCLLLPLAIGIAADVGEQRPWRVAGAVASVIVAVGAVGSGSRAALVGLAVAGVVAVLARRGLASPSARRWAIGAGAVIALVGVAAARSGVFERSAGSTSRLDEWRIATRAIAERPIGGAGPEGYRLVVGRFIDADYVRRFGETTGIDRTHSGVLDVATTSGIVTAAVYLALLAIVCWAALRALRASDALDAGFGAAVIAYAVQQQLLFPLAELDPTFWLFAGVVMVRVASASRWPRGQGTPRPSTARRVTAGLLGVTAALAAVLGVRAVAADRLARDATRSLDVTVAIDRAERASELAPWDIRHHLLLAQAHERERTLGGVDRALAAVDDALNISPLEPTSLHERARLLSLRAAITGTGTDRDAAARAWDEELRKSPNCARCHLGAGLAALERGDTDAARRLLATAADLGNADAAGALVSIGGD
jgi:O-antigen ligase